MCLLGNHNRQQPAVAHFLLQHAACLSLSQAVWQLGCGSGGLGAPQSITLTLKRMAFLPAIRMASPCLLHFAQPGPSGNPLYATAHSYQKKWCRLERPSTYLRVHKDVPCLGCTAVLEVIHVGLDRQQGRALHIKQPWV